MAASHSALLILDMQNDLVDPAGKVGATGLAAIIEERGVLRTAAGLINAARSTGVPVLYVGLSYREDYADVLSVAPRIARMKAGQVAVRGSWGSEFHPLVAPQPGDLVFHKQWVNPFFNTALQSWLSRQDVRNVALAGVATNLVVESAARHADDAGFAVTVVEDACASPNPAWHDFAVSNILPVFGAVAKAEQVISGWRA